MSHLSTRAVLAVSWAGTRHGPRASGGRADAFPPAGQDSGAGASIRASAGEQAVRRPTIWSTTQRSRRPVQHPFCALSPRGSLHALPSGVGSRESCYANPTWSAPGHLTDT